jgi:hypothetical protein
MFSKLIFCNIGVMKDGGKETAGADLLFWSLFLFTDLQLC